MFLMRRRAAAWRDRPALYNQCAMILGFVGTTQEKALTQRH
jgi:hypothetical protein